jgi:hypothetical protein
VGVCGLVPVLLMQRPELPLGAAERWRPTLASYRLTIADVRSKELHGMRLLCFLTRNREGGGCMKLGIFFGD